MRSLFFLVCFVLVLVAVEARVRYNSQLYPPYGLQFPDMTGDGVSEFLAWSGNKMYLTTMEFSVHPIAYALLPANAYRIIYGRFAGTVTSNRDIVCAQMTAIGRLQCYVTSNANDALLWWWYQGDFIGTRDVIVGDYNGDGRDDLLCYTPGSGTFQVYTWNQATGFFNEMSNWAPGNLATSYSLINYQVRAGDWNGDGRTDLIFYNQNAGQVIIFKAVFDSYDLMKYTMWWSFTSATGWGGSNWEVLVANLNGDATEDGVLHNVATGQYLTYQFIWDPATQKPQTLYVDLGQIHQGGNSRAYFGKFKTAPYGEDGGRSDIRDDSLVFSYDWGMWIRSGARFDGVKQTYWWAWTQLPIILWLDQDGDAIKTEHELGGYDPDNNGVSDGILPSFGASPFVKDIFVHVDFMTGPPGAAWNFALTPTSISLAVATMASKGINLHIFTGAQVAYQANLGNPKIDFDRDVNPIKWTNFPGVRDPFFHYCLMANRYDGGTSSGRSRDIVAQDFIVTLGGQGSTNQQVGTFLHELGHNLGLHHGGTDEDNYKPNHLSIMNYNYQFTGVNKDFSFQFIYSDVSCSNLNEDKLIESIGVPCVVGSSTYQSWIPYASAWVQITSADPAFDWDRDGTISPYYVSRDINNDGSKSTLNGGQNEYNLLVFNGGNIGSAPAKRSAERSNPTPPRFDVTEPPMEELRTHPEDYVEDFSAYDLKPHDGPQFLDVPHRHPVDFFASAEEAVIVTPLIQEETAPAEARNSKHESSKVNTDPFPDLNASRHVPAEYAEGLTMEGGAARNPSLYA